MIKAKRDNLRLACIRAGMNQNELAIKLGMKHPTISLLINGRIGASPKSAKAICDLFKMKFDDLFEVVDRPQKVGA